MNSAMPQFLNIYCDESSQNAHHYMVLGSVVCEKKDVEAIVERIRAFKIATGSSGELKWTKVKPANLRRYMALIDLFCELRAAEKLHFHSVIIDCSALNHTRYNDGDREIGFSKFIYQLLMKHCRIYDQDSSYYVYLDSRTTGHSLDELRNILNNGCMRKHKTSPFKTVEFRDSKKFELIQMCDVIIGAIAHHKNEKNNQLSLSKTAAAKNTASNYLREKLGLKILGNCTPATQRDFTIWNMSLKPR